jgi:steroid delta-isomerase-like uncharacterized protein
MATAEGAWVLDEWAAAWSAHDTERILVLYPDDCVYEDVAFGVVKHGKAALRTFAAGTFTVIPDFTVEVTARFVADHRGAWSGVSRGPTTAISRGCPPLASASQQCRGRRSSHCRRARSAGAICMVTSPTA